MTAAKTGLDQFLTYRMHAFNKLADRGIGAIYQAKLGISLSQARVIASVGSFGPFSIMDLAKRANLDKSQASRAAEALFQRDLLARQASTQDGRVVLVSLSTAGRALYRKVMPLARQWNSQVFDCLDPQELAAFSRTLDKAIACARQRAAQA